MTGRRRWLVAAVAAADAVAAGRGARRVRLVTKPLLMPLLAAALPGRRLGVDVALAASCAGDVALLGTGDAALAGGIAGFACAHLAYLRCLRPVDGPRRGVAERVSAGGFALAAVGAAAVVLPRLDERRELRLPVAGYAALVTAMGHAAVRAGLRGGDRGLVAGGVLFAVSDGLVARSLFGSRRSAVVDAAVMATYVAAQALLAGALVPAGGGSRGW